MKNLDKAFDKKFSNNAFIRTFKPEILIFIRQREKELIKEVEEYTMVAAERALEKVLDKYRKELSNE